MMVAYNSIWEPFDIAQLGDLPGDLTMEFEDT